MGPTDNLYSFTGIIIGVHFFQELKGAACVTFIITVAPKYQEVVQGRGKLDDDDDRD